MTEAHDTKTPQHCDTFTAVWRGVTLEITYQPNWLSMRERVGVVRLEVRSIAPLDAPLPVTETGYRSLFPSAEQVEAYNGPVDFVLAWLDHEACSPAWRNREVAAQQLTLF